MGPQSPRRASSMELVPGVPLRMKHPALPLLVSCLNEIAVVIKFPHIMSLTKLANLMYSFIGATSFAGIKFTKRELGS